MVVLLWGKRQLQPQYINKEKYMCLGIPGQITEIINADMMIAKVNFSGVSREVNIACIIDDAHPVASCVGAWVLVHVGFAMSRIDEDEAARTLKILEELGELL
jgi:hydrogenase expression/formation protein HypC